MRTIYHLQDLLAHTYFELDEILAAFKSHLVNDIFRECSTTEIRENLITFENLEEYNVIFLFRNKLAFTFELKYSEEWFLDNINNILYS